MSLYPSRDLSDLNTLAAPARAAHFGSARSVAEVREACAWAQELGLRLLVLGGGSNVVPERDIDAVVLQVAIPGVETLPSAEGSRCIRIGAGELWHELVVHTLAQGWFGLENLSLIPGTVGAAPIQNIGAYGVELSQVFESLDAVEIATGETRRFDRQACAFGYRDSIFKNALRGRYVITHVTLRLSTIPSVKLTYPALRQALADKPADQVTPKDVSDAVCAIRRSKLPDPAEVPNCGSFFKNPVVTPAQCEQLRRQLPDLVAYPAESNPDQVKLAAGWLIEKAGWKGKSLHGVGVHKDQALVLTNPQKLTADRVLAAASIIQDDIRRRFGVQLEIEPQPLR